MSSITSVNSVLMLSIAGLYPVPQQIQGYSADDIFDMTDVQSAETSMGVDGKLSAGFVFVPITFSLSLQADSDSNLIFDAWYAAQRAARELYFASGIVRLPAISRTFAMNRGVLKSYKPMSDAKKMLQPRKFVIEWESIVGAPL